MTPRMASGPVNARDCGTAKMHVAQIASNPTVPLLAGILHNARIVTTAGSQPIQTLIAGQKIITRGNGAVVVRRMEELSVVTRAIYILAGTIGHHRRDVDTMLPAGQTVLLRDWRAKAWSGRATLVQSAHNLVDGEFVRDLGLQVMALYRIYCDAPQIIYADGLELGTADMAPHVRCRQKVS